VNKRKWGESQIRERDFEGEEGGERDALGGYAPHRRNLNAGAHHGQWLRVWGFGIRYKGGRKERGGKE